MSRLLRSVVICAASFGLAATLAFAAGEQHVIAAQDTTALLTHSSQGYLGVVGSDVDSDRASALKLKEATGAEIVTVDRDGPACKAGLKVHDVILQLNGQPVAGEEQLRRMLLETPAGHNVTLLISRDGRQQTFSLKLGDRAAIETNAWSQPMVVPAPDDDGAFVLEGPSGHGTGNGFFGALSLGSPAIGVELDTLGSQLADYFGVKDGQGLLVKRVADNSPASRAGLKAGDVITKANGQKMATLNEWMKMLHTNRGKQVQLTLVRNKKEETLTLVDESGKNHGALVAPKDLRIFTGPEFIGDLAEVQNDSTPEIITIEPEQTIDMEELQKQLQEEQKKANQQMQQLQQQWQTLSVTPLPDDTVIPLPDDME